MSLKSVDDYNREKREKREEVERKLRLTGVACPKCGKELEWLLGPTSILYTYPPPTTAKANCRGCTLMIDLEK